MLIDLWEVQGPPVHVSVAAYMGLANTSKKKPKRAAGGLKTPANDAPASGNLNELASMFGRTGGNF